MTAPSEPAWDGQSCPGCASHDRGTRLATFGGECRDPWHPATPRRPLMHTTEAAMLTWDCEYCRVTAPLADMRPHPRGHAAPSGAWIGGFVCKDVAACDARDARNNPEGDE
jgi:hypothetical protein